MGFTSLYSRTKIGHQSKAEMSASSGNFILILHTHLPYVLHHGHWPHGREWLYEAASETYIPILNALHDLVQDGYSPKITISVTPVLAEQLADADFKKGFVDFLYDEIARAENDLEKFTESSSEKLSPTLAQFWVDYYRGILQDFTIRYNNDLIGALRRFQDQGVLEIMTCGATHGYFPLLGTDTSIDGQIKVAIATHEKHFGQKPRGIWLPECGYRPRYEWTPPINSRLGMEPVMRKGIEQILEENDIKYFIVDSSLVESGKSAPMYLGRFANVEKLRPHDDLPTVPEPGSVYERYTVKIQGTDQSSTVSVFARDVETSMQVWSSELGYPGGEWYLDFHKKHHESGHRYWRVTSLQSDMGLKSIYQPEKTDAALSIDVSHFIAASEGALENYKQQSGRDGVLTAPFDSELFGHWWFEGPRFLKYFFQQLKGNQKIRPTFATEVVNTIPAKNSMTLPEGSWGAGGNHHVWFNEDVSYMWPVIYNAEVTLKDYAKKYGTSDDAETIRLLKQLIREKLLLESSDWPFLISTLSAIDYAEERFSKHQIRFDMLTLLIGKRSRGIEFTHEDEDFLEIIFKEDVLFADDTIDVQWFA